MKVLLPIQGLRAVAAAAVVIGHFQGYTAPPGMHYWLPYNEMAGAGVDLFFVISGFVMVYSSTPFFGPTDGPASFLSRRIIRIVPLYWFCTTIYVVIATAAPSFDIQYSGEFLAKSYFFIPVARPSGDINPVVGQGWTLNYEMLFYVIFAPALLASRFRAVSMVSLVLVTIVAAGALFAPRSLLLAF